MKLLENKYFHIIFPIALAIIMNIIIYYFGWNKNYLKDDYKNIKLIPPGYIIGIIWILIFGFLGYAHYLLYIKKRNFTFGMLLIELVILFCLAYPILTSGLKKINFALYLNYITLLLAFILGFIVFNESKIVLIYILPLILWSVYINYADVYKCTIK